MNTSQGQGGGSSCSGGGGNAQERLSQLKVSLPSIIRGFGTNHSTFKLPLVKIYPDGEPGTTG